MVTVLIAHGPNEIVIPCRLFETVEDGREYCDPLFAKVNAFPEPIDYKSVRYTADLDGGEGTEEVSAELFTSHYYGCGGPYRFVLKEIPFNEKFVPFDLD